MFPTDVVIVAGARTPMAHIVSWAAVGVEPHIMGIGAIPRGHSLGATGTRPVLTPLYEIRRRNLRYGLATACVEGSQGIALLVEFLS